MTDQPDAAERVERLAERLQYAAQNEMCFTFDVVEAARVSVMLSALLSERTADKAKLAELAMEKADARKQLALVQQLAAENAGELLDTFSRATLAESRLAAAMEALKTARGNKS